MEREKILSLEVGFENMAKIIGGRWKALGDEERAPYKAKAVVSFSRQTFVTCTFILRSFANNTLICIFVSFTD